MCNMENVAGFALFWQGPSCLWHFTRFVAFARHFFSFFRGKILPKSSRKKTDFSFQLTSSSTLTTLELQERLRRRRQLMMLSRFHQITIYKLGRSSLFTAQGCHFGPNSWVQRVENIGFWRETFTKLGTIWAPACVHLSRAEATIFYDVFRWFCSVFFTLLIIKDRFASKFGPRNGFFKPYIFSSASTMILILCWDGFDRISSRSATRFGLTC